MENLFNELIKVDDNLKNGQVDTNLLANNWTLDYNRNNNNSKLLDLQWSSDYLTQTESTLYNET
jgi:hypothetical protein